VVEDAIIAAPRNGAAQIVVNNCSGFTQCVPRGTYLGEAETAQVLSVLEPGKRDPNPAETVTVKQTTSEAEAGRKEKLLETIRLPELPSPDSELLREFLTDHHDVFSLEEGERGETDLVSMEIDTKGAIPKKQPPRLSLIPI